jgi:transketolase
MVSQAGGMALMGLIPIVHSFACFLSSRPNEQIYNNSTELSKIIYVGSLTGIIPAGPGHSHQAVRDIASLSAIPGLTLIEPCCEIDLAAIMHWAININNFSSYIRLVSAPFLPIEGFSLNGEIILGRGTYIKKGKGLTIITSGPLFGKQMLEVAELFKSNQNFDIQVIITPWLNVVDIEWYKHQLLYSDFIAIVENHYVDSGFGEYLSSQFSQAGILNGKNIKLVGLNEKPMSGQQDEVLNFHKLDAQNIYINLTNFIKKSNI